MVTSLDGGAHVRAVHGLEPNGPVAAPPGAAGTIVIAEPSSTLAIDAPDAGARAPSSAIVRTANDGGARHSTVDHDHGAGFIDLQFVGATAGRVVHVSPGGPAGELLRTTDAGVTFRAVPAS